MKPEAQRIAIAEACGWTDLDYTEDLNAMHDAEKMLTDEQDLEYSETLEQVVDGRFIANNAEDMRRLRSATAAQRAEAFLRTIGKWEGE